MTAPPHVVGLDLSLTSTGVGIVEGDLAWAERLRPRAALGTGHDRLEWLLQSLREYVAGASLVVVEGLLPYGSGKSRGTSDRAGYWHLVVHGLLWCRGIPYAEMSPTGRAKYATGRGGASKDEVLLAIARRFPAVEFQGNDQADGLALAAAGADHLGHPVVTMPDTHREALGAVQWPTVA